MTEETAKKPWLDLDHKRSLEKQHRMEHLDSHVRREVWRRACADARLLSQVGPKNAMERAVAYIDNEYADLARLIKRAHRAGRKAGAQDADLQARYSGVEPPSETRRRAKGKAPHA